MFPDWFKWENYAKLYNEKNPARWALLFAERSEESEQIGDQLSIVRTQKSGEEWSNWQTEWSNGVLCTGIKGCNTQKRIEQLEVQSRSLVVAIDISAPLDKEKMLQEIERLYKERIGQFAWSVIDKQKTIKRETSMQWARGLAAFDLLQEGNWSKYKIEKYLVPLWNQRQSDGEPTQADRKQLSRALDAVKPMILKGWKELSYHPRTKE